MKLPPAFVTEEKDLVNVVVETPKGSRNKFDFDEQSWLFRQAKVLPAGVVFPLDFGFIPHTKCEDGDPIDVLAIVEQPSYPGCLLSCRLVGIIEGEQTEKDGETVRNDRLLAVPDYSIEYSRIREAHDLSQEFVNDLAHFFIYYNQMAGKKYKLLAVKGADAALAAVKKAMK